MMNKPIRLALPTTPIPIGTVNSYLFREPTPTLVDCGPDVPACWQSLQEQLAEQGLAVADIERVVITHAHVDHMGMAGKIAEHSQAEVWVSPLVYDWAVNYEVCWQQKTAFMQDVLARTGVTGALRQFFEGYVQGVPALWARIPAERVITFALDKPLEMGGLAWDVIETPGHTYTQTCFYQPDTQQLLGADMLLPIAPIPVMEGERYNPMKRARSLQQLLKSYGVVKALPAHEVYPGHGTPFTQHRQLIERQLERIQARKEACYEGVKNGHGTLPALLDILYAHLAEVERHGALAMLVGYLDLLEDEGRVQREEQDGIWQFQVKG